MSPDGNSQGANLAAEKVECWLDGRWIADLFAARNACASRAVADVCATYSLLSPIPTAPVQFGRSLSPEVGRSASVKCVGYCVSDQRGCMLHTRSVLRVAMQKQTHL